ncbi:TonB-dependent receptor [Pseudoalteromonas sp. CF6-2]|uniref:TonB-dependent receptor plug domain-containing protein n=1 Tax=Pseudoalteromonas sp. CF6-2 TaxID=562716 RepID=UPI001F18691B|nr:TonB-dependent receptor [Pseudoalteromonas sp. CF6-2]
MNTQLFRPSFSFSKIAAALSCVLSISVFADDSIEVIEVQGYAQNNHQLVGSADSLLSDLGVDFSAAGGVSNLPVMNGMMGDRVKVLVDGADVTAACANQMNPPLSYVSANQISSYSVVAGVSPVSSGGDNIAGVIRVNTIAPEFSDTDSLNWRAGYVTAQYKSVNDSQAYGLGASLTSKQFSLSYQGSFEDANSYDDGHGDRVLDTLYRVQNHALTGAVRDNKQQLVVKLSHQRIPYQGFPNQYMDMTDNTSYGLVAQYQRELADSNLHVQVNYHDVKHEMGFFSAEKTGMMPMNTDAKDYSYQIHWRTDLTKQSSLMLGQEYYNYRIDDWWPAVAGSMMMGPNEYININEGKRDRLGAFAEYQNQVNQAWWLSAGVRVEQVTTNTGDVQAYNEGGMGHMGSMMHMSKTDAQAAMEFNQLDRKRDDTLVDMSLLARYQLTNNDELQFGLARKNRAPNLYERYSWGVGTMATTMIGWFGDGNGYIGNPDLEAETAHTLSASYTKLAKDDSWQITANIWYTQVSDYIDAEVTKSFNRTDMAHTERNILTFTNLDATLYGAKLAGLVELHNSKQAGKWQLKGSLTSSHGERDDSNEDLYQIMPLNTKLSVEHEYKGWQNALNWQWVDSKTNVDERRLENKTDSYQLLAISSQKTWQNLTFKLAITNLLDEYYQQPLGGVSIANYKQDMSKGFEQLAGQGRSYNASISYRF